VIQTATEATQALPVSQDARSGSVDAAARGKKPEGKGGLGLFAKILAGLHGKQGLGTDASTETGEVAESGDPKSALGVGGSRAGRTVSAVNTEAGTAEQNLKLSKLVEGELSQTGLSEHEINIIGNISALAAASLSEEIPSQPATPAIESVGLFYPDGESASLGVPNVDPKPESGRAALVQTVQGQSREVATETAQGELANAAIASGADSSAEEAAGVRSAELAERPRNSGDRPALGQAEAGLRDSSVGGLDEKAQSQGAFANSGRGNGQDETGLRDQRRNLVAEARELRVNATHAKTGAAGSGDSVNRAESVKDMIVEVRLPTQNGTSSATTVWESRPIQSSQSMENLLVRELQQHLNGDIVRQASLILREGSDGTIRLALRPESLGNVKIHLEMAENKITGFIVVESEEAMRAFEREIESMEKEFMDAGFDGAELQMSLADGGAGQGRETEDGSFTPLALAASRYDASSEMGENTVSVSVFVDGTGTVDVFA